MYTMGANSIKFLTFFIIIFYSIEVLGLRMVHHHRVGGLFGMQLQLLGKLHPDAFGFQQGHELPPVLHVRARRIAERGRVPFQLGVLGPRGGGVVLVQNLGIPVLEEGQINARGAVVEIPFPASVKEIVLSGFQSKMGWRPFYSSEEKALAREKLEKMASKIGRASCRERV